MQQPCQSKIFPKWERSDPKGFPLRDSEPKSNAGIGDAIRHPSTYDVGKYLIVMCRYASRCVRLRLYQKPARAIHYRYNKIASASHKEPTSKSTRSLIASRVATSSTPQLNPTKSSAFTISRGT